MKGILTTKDFKKKITTARGVSYIWTCTIGEHKGDIFTTDEPGAELVIGTHYEYQYTPSADSNFLGAIKIVTAKAFNGGSGGSAVAAGIAADTDLKIAALNATVDLIKDGKITIAEMKSSIAKIYIILKELKTEL